MTNLLDLISSLTTADSRAGQGKLVKANKATSGYSSVIKGVGTPTLNVAKGDILGIIQDTATVSITNTAGKSVRLAYSKIELQESYYEVNGDLVSYLWFPSRDVDFDGSSSVKEVVPVSEDKELKPVYSDAPKGIRIREKANTVSKELKLVSYGDIVGYTDEVTAKYLSYTFWKIYDSKGKFIGWCAKGKGFSSLTKPQAKALPKLDENGETEQTYGSVSENQDPQSGNASTSGIITILAWTVGIIAGGYFLFKGIKWLFTPKN